MEFDEQKVHQETSSQHCSTINPSTMIICGSGNPHGDAYCCFKAGGMHFHEVHQYKHTMETITLDILQSELEKAACSNDLFVFFTTGTIDFELEKLPSNVVIVSEENWENYFGPFWARIFYLKSVTPININTATSSQIRILKSFGEIKTERIISERKKSKFVSMEDAFNRLKKQKGNK
jgi:hypothetical protein